MQVWWKKSTHEYDEAYLKEYEKTKLNSDTVKVPLISPSNESTSILLSIYKFKLICLINWVKQILLLNISSPTPLIKSVI